MPVLGVPEGGIFKASLSTDLRLHCRSASVFSDDRRLPSVRTGFPQPSNPYSLPRNHTAKIPPSHPLKKWPSTKRHHPPRYTRSNKIFCSRLEETKGNITFATTLFREQAAKEQVSRIKSIKNKQDRLRLININKTLIVIWQQ